MHHMSQRDITFHTMLTLTVGGWHRRGREARNQNLAAGGGGVRRMGGGARPGAERDTSVGARHASRDETRESELGISHRRDADVMDEATTFLDQSGEADYTLDPMLLETMSFTLLYLEHLRNRGWKLHGTRILRPTAQNGQGTEGEDWFEGEQAVMHFLKRKNPENRAELPWDRLWHDKLEPSGWTKRLVQGVGEEQYEYIKPRPHPLADGEGEEGTDFFRSIKTVRAYVCARNLREDCAGALKQSAEHDVDEDSPCRRQSSSSSSSWASADLMFWEADQSRPSPSEYSPQKMRGLDDVPNGKPVLSGAASHTMRIRQRKLYEESDSTVVLTRLRDYGWTVEDCESGGLWVRPGARERRLGRDCFKSSGDVVDFVRKNRIDGATRFGHVDEDEPDLAGLEFGKLWRVLEEHHWRLERDERRCANDRVRWILPGVQSDRVRPGIDYATTEEQVRDIVRKNGPAPTPPPDWTALVQQRFQENLWPSMRRIGWRIEDGKYLRPGCNRPTLLNQDYFTSPDDVVRFVVEAELDGRPGKVGHIDEGGGLAAAREDEHECAIFGDATDEQTMIATLHSLGWRTNIQVDEPRLFYRPGAFELRDTAELVPGRHYFRSLRDIVHFVRERKLDGRNTVGHVNEDPVHQRPFVLQSNLLLQTGAVPGAAEEDNRSRPSSPLSPWHDENLEAPASDDDVLLSFDDDNGGPRPPLLDVGANSPTWSFAEVWPRLRGCGWTCHTSVRPHIYCRPGAQQNGGELGRDYFDTEGDVLRFIHEWRVDFNQRTGDVSEQDLVVTTQAPSPHLQNKEEGPYAGPKTAPVWPDSDVVDARAKFPPSTTFKQLWEQLSACGWRRWQGSGLVRFYRPGSQEAQNGVAKDNDYFVSEDAVMDFVREWGVDFESRTGHVGESAKVKPQNFEQLWRCLKACGWRRWKGNGLCRHYRPGARENQDYFVTENAVINFVREWGVDYESRTGHVDEKEPPCNTGHKNRSATHGGDDAWCNQATPFDVVTTSRAELSELSDLDRAAFRPLWIRLLSCGWRTEIGVDGSSREYCRPGAMPQKSGGKCGRDYFRATQDVVEFASKWGIDFKTRTGAITEREKEHAPEMTVGRQSRNADEALLKRGTFSPKESRETSFSSLWIRLQACGWRAEDGKPPTRYSYFRPSAPRMCDGPTLGVDYFVTEDDVISFARTWGIDFKGRTGDVKELKWGDEGEYHTSHTPLLDEIEQQNLHAPLPNEAFQENLHTPLPDEREQEDRHAPLPDDHPDNKTGENLYSEDDDCEATSARMTLAPATCGTSASVFSKETEEPLWERSVSAMWEVLQDDCGWTAEEGNGCYPYLYFRPGACRNRDISKLGTEYFASEDDLIDFVRSWAIDGSDRTGHVNEDPPLSFQPEASRSEAWRQRRATQTDGLQDSGEDSNPDGDCESVFSSETEGILWSRSASAMWEVLQNDCGWTWKTGNGVYQFLYFRPGACSDGVVAKLGTEYFVSEYDVSQFVRLWAIDGRERTGHIDEAPPLGHQPMVVPSDARRQRRATRTNTTNVGSEDGDLAATQWSQRRSDGVLPTSAKGALDRAEDTPLRHTGKEPLWKRRASAVWDTLMGTCGWTRSKSGADRSYVYFRPGACTDKRASEPEKDYFKKEDDVIDFVTRWAIDGQVRTGHVEELPPPNYKPKMGASVADNRSERICPAATLTVWDASDGCPPSDQRQQTPKDTTMRSKDATRSSAQSSVESSSCSEAPTPLWERALGDMWKVLKNDCGWTWKPGSGMHSFLYFRPGANLDTNVSEMGKDYFVLEDDIVDFVRRWDINGSDRKGHVAEEPPPNYEPKGGATGATQRHRRAVRHCRSQNTEHKDPPEIRHSSERRRRDTRERGTARPEDIVDSGMKSECESEPLSPEDVTWNVLRTKCGWTWGGGGCHHSYFYFRPGARTSKGTAKPEQDYFTSENEVAEFVKRWAIDGSKRTGHVNEEPPQNYQCPEPDDIQDPISDRRPRLRAPANKLDAKVHNKLDAKVHASKRHQGRCAKSAPSTRRAKKRQNPTSAVGATSKKRASIAKLKSVKRQPKSTVRKSRLWQSQNRPQALSKTPSRDTAFWEWTFIHIWDELSYAGWTRHNSWRRLENYRYYKPGFTRGNEGVVGEDYFTSVDAILQYLKRKNIDNPMKLLPNRDPTSRVVSHRQREVDKSPFDDGGIEPRTLLADEQLQFEGDRIGHLPSPDVHVEDFPSSEGFEQRARLAVENDEGRISVGANDDSLPQEDGHMVSDSDDDLWPPHALEDDEVSLPLDDEIQLVSLPTFGLTESGEAPAHDNAGRSPRKLEDNHALTQSCDDDERQPRSTVDKDGQVACSDLEDESTDFPQGAYESWASLASGGPLVSEANRVDARQKSWSLTARSFENRYEAIGFTSLYAILQEIGWRHKASSRLDARGGLIYIAPGAREVEDEQVLGRDYFVCASDVVDYVKSDPNVVMRMMRTVSRVDQVEAAPDDWCGDWIARAIAEVGGDDDSGHAFGDVCPRASAYFLAAAGSRRTTSHKRKAGLTTRSRAKRVRAADSARARENILDSAREMADIENFRAPTSTEIAAFASSRVHADLEERLHAFHASAHFGIWHAQMRVGWSLLLHGFGSKRRILDAFVDDELSQTGRVVVIEGYAANLDLRAELLAAAAALKLQLPAATSAQFAAHRGTALGVAKRIKAALLRDAEDDTYVHFVIHSIDGPKLRQQQQVLAELKCDRSTLACSVDHINAPLLWHADLVETFDWLWVDATTFAWYDAEAPLPELEGQTCKIQSNSIDTEGITYVLQSFVARQIEVLHVAANLARQSLSNLRRQQGPSGPPSFSFRDLSENCRLLFIPDTQLKTFIREFIDQRILQTTHHRGTEYYSISHDYIDAILQHPVPNAC